MTYLERLQQSKDSKDASKALMNSREAHLQLTKDALDAEKRKLAAEAKLEVLKGTFPIDTVEIIKAKYEAEAAEQNFIDLMELTVELFPENVRFSTEEPAPAKRTAAPKKRK